MDAVVTRVSIKLPAMETRVKGGEEASPTVVVRRAGECRHGRRRLGRWATAAWQMGDGSGLAECGGGGLAEGGEDGLEGGGVERREGQRRRTARGAAAPNGLEGGGGGLEGARSPERLGGCEMGNWGLAAVWGIGLGF